MNTRREGEAMGRQQWQRAAAVAVGACVALGAAACGSESERAAQPETAEAWADALCDAGLELANELEPVAEDLAVATAEAGGDGQSEPSLEDIVALFGDLETALGQMNTSFTAFATTVEQLGPPPVEGGEEFHDGITSTLDQATSAFQQLTQVLGSFGEDITLQELMGMQQEFEQLGAAFESIDSFEGFQEEAPPELAEALDQSETCTEAEQRFDEVGAKFDESEL